MTIYWVAGWSAPRQVWDQQLPYWSDYQHVTIDFLQCQTIEQMRQVMITEINRSKPFPFIVVGWSMGAMLSMELASLWQDRLTHLFLVGMTGKFTSRRKDDLNTWHPRVLDKMSMQLKQNLAQAIAQFDPRLFSSTELSKGYLRKWQLAYRQKLPTLPSLQAGLQYLQNYDATNMAGNIQIPIHLLTGIEDKICPVESGLALSQQLPRSSYVVLEQAGHLPFWTQPEGFRDWMKKRI